MSEEINFVWKWRMYLLLLATLVASATYVAGLNPPGGVWLQEERGTRIGQPPLPPTVYPNGVGDPVLQSTYSLRFTVFFYCNAAAFVASLVIILFLMDRRLTCNRVGLTVLRSAMLVDLLALIAAFAAGSSRDVIASMYVWVLFAVVFVYVAIHVRLASRWGWGEVSAATEEDKLKLKERVKLLMLLATFATPLTYGAGLTPPGGFWSQTEYRHRAGAPLLHDGRHKVWYDAFFYSNATSFIASLAIIMLLMSRKMSHGLAQSHALPVCVLVELLTLMAAYATGSCRRITTTVYVVSLVGAVLLYILLQVGIAVFAKDMFMTRRAAEEGVTGTADGDQAAKVDDSQSLMLRLPTLAATVTYQAGLSPPGGVWPVGHPHHIPGNPILLDMHPKRYMAFYHCNTVAFVASLVVIIILQSNHLSSRAIVRRSALKTAMILDMFGLMGAYVAGSSQDVTTTIYVSALATVAVFVYPIAKILDYRGRHVSGSVFPNQREDHLRKTCKFWLQVAILAATVTYQTGLNPPGGFWLEPESKENRSLTAGDPVLLDHYRTRYQVFFYCNATGFTASVAIILLLVNPTMYRLQVIRDYALPVYIMVWLLALLGSYAAGSCRKLGMSIYVIALVAALTAFEMLHILCFVFMDRTRLSEQSCLGWWLERFLKTWPEPIRRAREDIIDEVPATISQQEHDNYKKRKCLMLPGILAASVTYQAGLAPPGGTWGDDDTATSPSPSPWSNLKGYVIVAGNPVLLNTNGPRYQAFFYCNATSFVASVVVITLLLLHNVMRHGAPPWAMQTAVVLSLLGLLGAYAIGSCRNWETSAYVIALLPIVVVLITLHALLSFDIVAKLKLPFSKLKESKVWKYFGG